ncbi:DMT family transporter [Phytomonospora sp. NPDC050363]|uniref:DMT family transporter n=1 Tax=Phytomonospora sp. NPDC050363 TaxID=3155642 RepID=UPI0033EF2E60
MHPLAIVLVLAAAVTHAVWNLYAKRASDGGVVFIWLNAAVSTVVYLPVGVAALILSPPQWTPWVPVALVGSGLIHLGYFSLLQRGYRHGDLTVVYPLARGTGPALSVLMAMLFFGERPGPIGLLGAAGVVAGILIIGLSQKGDGSGKVAAGVLYGIATGLVIATYTIFDAWAVGPLAISPFIFDWVSNAVRVSVLSPYTLRRRDEIARVWREHRVPVIVVGLLAPMAYILVLFAYRYADVSLVAPARELSIVVGSLLGWLLLREQGASRRIAGAVVVLGGVIALALARV